jgi:hypothetical protein
MTSAQREALGKIVREVWIDWAKEQPNPKQSWLEPWENLAEPDKEVDRRIGERLFNAGMLNAAEILRPEIWPNNKYSVSTICESMDKIRRAAECH